MGSSSQVKINYEPALPTGWLVEAVHRIYGPSDPSPHVLAIINDFMEFHEETCVKMASPLNCATWMVWWVGLALKEWRPSRRDECGSWHEHGRGEFGIDDKTRS